MMNIQSILGCGMAAMLATNVGASGGGVEAWLETEKTDGSLIVTPYARATEGGMVTYRLISLKSGTSGTTRSSQSGQVDLSPGASESLSTLQLGVSGDDRYNLVLQIFTENQLVATVSEQFPP